MGVKNNTRKSKRVIIKAVCCSAGIKNSTRKHIGANFLSGGGSITTRVLKWCSQIDVDIILDRVYTLTHGV